jgi:Transposase DDE domain/Transposase DNA-binding
LGIGSFGSASLGDSRRSKRLVRVARSFFSGACCGGGGTITSVIPAIHQAKAAYRLLGNASVTHQAVIQPHCQYVRSMLDEPGVTLLIEDSTAIAYPGLKQSTGLGPIGEGFTRGFWLHSTLAARWEPSPDAQGRDLCWPIGLLHQHAWARPPAKKKKRKSNGRGKESNSDRQKRKNRESVRWAAALADLPARSHADSSLIYVADRESDIYEVFQKCQAAGVSFIIRAAYARALAEDELGIDLMSAAGKGPVRGYLDLDLPQHNRTAKMEVRGTKLELRGPARPGGRPENITLGVVHVREIDPPAGVEALEWTLLTDQPIDTLKDCEHVVRIYRCRWMIEELHKGMKTGLGLELSQFSDYRRLSALGGIVSVVAVHLLQMKWSGRIDGEQPLEEEQNHEPMVKLLEKIHPPSGTKTRRWLWTSIARLGGYQARNSDGPPGWLTLWRGWQTLQTLLRGYQLAEP